MRSLFVLLCLAFPLWSSTWADDPPAREAKKVEGGKPRKPRFGVSKETTYATGPRDAAGYVDYVAALNLHLGKDVKPEKNANVLFWKAWGPRPEGGRGMPAEFYVLLGIPELPDGDDYFVDSHKYLRERLREAPGAAFEDELDHAGSRPWKSKEFPQLASWLKANDVPLRLMREGSLRSQYYSPLAGGGEGGLIAVLLPGVQKARSLGQALVIRAMLNLGEGRLDEAWSDLQTCHRLGRHIARGGTLIEGLVGVALDNIASGAEVVYLDRGNLDAKKVRTCLQDLQKLPPMPDFAEKIDFAERFMMLEIVTAVERHGARKLDSLAGLLGIDGPLPIPDTILDKVAWDPGLRHINGWYNRMSDAMRLKDRAEREKKLGDLQSDLASLKDELAEPAKVIKMLVDPKTDPEARGKKMGDILVSLLLPAVRKVQAARDRSEQTQRNLLVAYALAAHQRDLGSYPKNLDALTPKYLAAIPNDIYSGKALIYRTTKSGFLVYSVGPNGEDEGGRWFDDDPAGDDPRVRIPAPERKKE